MLVTFLMLLVQAVCRVDAKAPCTTLTNQVFVVENVPTEESPYSIAWYASFDDERIVVRTDRQMEIATPQDQSPGPMDCQAVYESPKTVTFSKVGQRQNDQIDDLHLPVHTETLQNSLIEVKLKHAEMEAAHYGTWQVTVFSQDNDLELLVFDMVVVPPCEYSAALEANHDPLVRSMAP